MENVSHNPVNLLHITTNGHIHHHNQQPKPKSLKACLQNGECLYGMSLQSFSSTMAEIAGWTGYDFIVIDLEHGFGGISEALHCIQVLSSTDTHVIVRVPDVNHVWVKKVLDLGPHGLIFPLVDGPETAKRAVSYCRYPPDGVRGVASPIVRASRFGMNPDYAREYWKELLILCQVETEQAVEKVAEIAAVEGVDGIMVGPSDLCASVGLMREPGNEKVREMMRKIERTVLGAERKEGGGPFLAAMAMPFDGATVEEFSKRGYQLIRGATDVGLFRNVCVEDVKRFNFKDNEAMHAKYVANADVNVTT